MWNFIDNACNQGRRLDEGWGHGSCELDQVFGFFFKVDGGLIFTKRRLLEWKTIFYLLGYDAHMI